MPRKQSLCHFAFRHTFAPYSVHVIFVADAVCARVEMRAADRQITVERSYVAGDRAAAAQ